MASCVRNIHTKNYQNLVIDFQVAVENIGDAFLGHSDMAALWQASLAEVLLPMTLHFVAKFQSSVSDCE